MAVELPDYSAPPFLFHPHLETIFPAVLRQVRFEEFERERMGTDDDDFIDLDWSRNNNEKLAILCHGLEGNSRRPYMKGMAKKLSSKYFDILSWNYRGCSDEINRQARYYHSGATDDLDRVVRHAIEKDKYKEIYLVGFSLGGNLVLKYLGEDWNSKKSINAGVAVSVPVDLEGCSVEIHKPNNWIYSNRFLASLKAKVRAKAKMYPDLIKQESLSDIKTLRDFDDIYTARLHGFTDATDYYKQCSSVRFLENIDIPVLILNAKNDTFLSQSCYPEEIARKKSNIELIIPERGGHVGFSSRSGWGTFWSEEIVSNFFEKTYSTNVSSYKQ